MAVLRALGETTLTPTLGTRSHRFARGSRRGSGRRPELHRLGAKRPPRRAAPQTRGRAGCPSEPRHRQVRPPRQGGRSAEKRPLRAERPVLPRPGAAVLSARWGLTAEFGMGSGDPPLHGSARGRRSRGNRLAVRGARGSPAPPWRLHARDTSISRSRS